MGGEAESYENVEIHFVQGMHKTLLRIYHYNNDEEDNDKEENEVEVEVVELSALATIAEMHQLFLEKGFVLKPSDEVARIQKQKGAALDAEYQQAEDDYKNHLLMVERLMMEQEEHEKAAVWAAQKNNNKNGNNSDKKPAAKSATTTTTTITAKMMMSSTEDHVRDTKKAVVDETISRAVNETASSFNLLLILLGAFAVLFVTGIFFKSFRSSKQQQTGDRPRKTSKYS